MNKDTSKQPREDGRFSARVKPAVLLEKFQESATRERRSVSAQVALAMEEYLKNHHPDLVPGTQTNTSH